MTSRSPETNNCPPDSGSDQSWERPQLTSGTLFVLGAMNLIDCINVTLLSPYVNRMVSDFVGRPTDDASVIEAVGYLIALYSLCEVVFSPLWGYLADKFGRRPVMLVGLAGSAFAPILFGLADDLPLAFIARGLDGFFCGNIGVTKTYLGELVDATNEARGFSFIAVCFSLGMIIGPTLGGQLVDPALWMPTIFEGTVFERRPYLLPNLTYACFAAISWILGVCFLKETLPPSKRQWACWKERQSSGLATKGIGESHGLSPDIAADTSTDPWQKSQGTRVAMLFVSSYCLLTAYYTAWYQDFIMIVSLPRSISGFAFGPREIGVLTNIAGVGLMSTQLLIYPCLTQKIGFLKCFVGGCVVNVTMALFFPVYGLLADPVKFGAWRYVPLAAMMLFSQAGIGFCFPTMFVWINRALEGKDRGTWNGCINSLGALFRAVFPPLVNALLSLGLSSGLTLGRYLPVFVNALAGVATLVLTVISVRAQEGESVARKLAAGNQEDASAVSMQPFVSANDASA